MSKLCIDIGISLADFNLGIKQELPMQGITGIFGHSGSGKSTLLRAIAGLESRTLGTISLKQRQLLDSANQLSIAPEKRRVSLVFQDSRLFPHLSVKGNLLFAIKRCNKNKLDLDEIIELTELAPLLNKDVGRLSGGEQQRVALARAILTEPELLLLDEPLSALDKNSKLLMLDLLTKVQAKLKLPVLYVSHSLAELQQVADHLLLLEDGRAIDFGNIHQVIHRLNYQDMSHQQTSLSLPVKRHLPEHGLTCLSLAQDKEIYLPLQSQSNSGQGTGETLRCFIPAGDISITLDEPVNSSIVNHLKGEIKEIKQQGKAVLIQVQCHQQVFYVRITSLSFAQLSLSPQKQVYIQFKAGAVHTLNNYHGE